MQEKKIVQSNDQKIKLTGLTSEEAARLTREGKANVLPDTSSQTVGSIIFRNVCTYFNAIFFGLAILVIIVGAYRNLTFMPVVIANMIIGIVQQLRAKKVLDALSLLDVTEFTVIRDGKDNTIAMEKLVLGDLVRLGAGQQIPADAQVVEGSVSVNEALLTGEADEIEKLPGSELMSGSFVVSGSCVARLTKVGEESYAAKLTRKAKEVKNKKSEMIRDIELIILVAGIVIIPVGIAMVYSSVALNGHTMQEGIVSMVGAVVGMIPEGLYLLLTVALTMSAARLARNKVLLHDMKSIETLARVDVLCVDKTGTITSDVMTVTDLFLPADDAYAGEDESKMREPTVEELAEMASRLRERESLLAGYAATVPDTNITMEAIRKYLPKGNALQAEKVVPFSSKLKYSEIRTEDMTYRFGAPEFLLSQDQLKKNQARIEERTGRGKRVLALIRTAKEGDEAVPLLFVALENEIRKTAPATFTYFREQGVEIKVISGDNPLTVSRVAMAACIEKAEKYVDASTLEKEEDYLAAVREYTVFGRVKPEQKKLLIEAIKKNGKKVAMTGDGVNDILAMKEADCSIAMGGGSDAARQAAQVVLMDSDFSHMEQIVTEGRRIINNMTRSGILFLYKNIFSLLLAVFTILLSMQYPMRPTQISLISGFNIGLPGFLLAMENNTRRQRGRLLTRTLKGAFPAAVLSFIMVSVLMIFGSAFSLTEDEIGVASTYLLSAVCFLLLWKLIHPLNRYRILVFGICIAAMILGIVLLWDVFILAEVSFKGSLISLGYAMIGAVIMWVLSLIMQRVERKKEQGQPEIS